jgi:16S rRNA (guanine527-N7)-methyltransferase
MSPEFAVELSSALAALELPLPERTQQQLLSYLSLIERWNKVYNLTAIRQPHDMLVQHLFDCLAVLPPLRRAAQERTGTPDGALRILDVGSGAGLPGVVLAACQPTWQVTCVDTVAKKAMFIRQVAAELALPNLTATHQRVEDMPEDARFDLITCRAFASLADFIALSRDRLAPGGTWVAMKAKLTDTERQAVPANVVMFHVEPLQVPQLAAERCLAWMRPAA